MYMSFFLNSEEVSFILSNRSETTCARGFCLSYVQNDTRNDTRVSNSSPVSKWQNVQHYIRSELPLGGLVFHFGECDLNLNLK